MCHSNQSINLPYHYKGVLQLLIRRLEQSGKFVTSQIIQVILNTEIVYKHMCLYRKIQCTWAKSDYNQKSKIITVQCSFYHHFFDLSFQEYFTLFTDVIISSISQVGSWTDEMWVYIVLLTPVCLSLQFTVGLLCHTHQISPFTNPVKIAFAKRSFFLHSCKILWDLVRFRLQKSFATSYKKLEQTGKIFNFVHNSINPEYWNGVPNYALI